MTATTIAASPLGDLGTTSTQLLALALMTIATIRVIRTPARHWAHGTWSKTGWILATLTIVINPDHLTIPLGAIAALYANHRAQRREDTTEHETSEPESLWTDDQR